MLNIVVIGVGVVGVVIVYELSFMLGLIIDLFDV